MGTGLSATGFATGSWMQHQGDPSKTWVGVYDHGYYGLRIELPQKAMHTSVHLLFRKKAAIAAVNRMMEYIPTMRSEIE